MGIASLLVGSIFFAFVFGQMVVMLSNLTRTRDNFRMRCAGINEAMKQQRLPPDMQTRELSTAANPQRHSLGFNPHMPLEGAQQIHMYETTSECLCRPEYLLCGKSAPATVRPLAQYRA